MAKLGASAVPRFAATNTARPESSRKILALTETHSPKALPAYLRDLLPTRALAVRNGVTIPCIVRPAHGKGRRFNSCIAHQEVRQSRQWFSRFGNRRFAEA